MMQMKNKPFYGNGWGMTQPGYYQTPSKVVSIPVHFVGSERSRNDSAIKIQKVLRGFLVRNTLRKISATRVELERIESEVRLEVMKMEPKVRLRVSETIMNLLLKLDSARVFHYSGLRDYRKSLINKAIALQEMLDQMSLPDSEGAKIKEKEGECVGEEHCLSKEEEGNRVETLKNGELEMEEEEEENEGERLRADDCFVKEKEANGIQTLNNWKVHKEENGCMEEESIGVGTSLVEENVAEIRCEEQEGGEEIEALRNEEVEEKEDSEGERGFVGENFLVKEEGDCQKEEGERKKMELLEKMVEENQMMIEMMTQLFQRNEMQTRLLTSLAQRVEQLEYVFACEKMRRKKKGKVHARNKQAHPKIGFI